MFWKKCEPCEGSTAISLKPVSMIALAPVLPFLSPFILGVAVIGVVGGLWCDRYERYPLNTVLATMAAVAGIAYYGIQITRTDAATTVAHAMIILLAIRLLRPKESRDYLQIFALALFLLAGSSLISLDLGLGFGFLTYLVLMVFCVTLGLVLLTVFVTDKRLALPLLCSCFLNLYLRIVYLEIGFDRIG